MTYYIIENQSRTDGIINTTTTSRAKFSSAESYYHERVSKMYANTEFVKVSVILADEDLAVVEHITINLQDIAE